MSTFMVKIVDLRNSYTNAFKIARAHSTCLCLPCKQARWGALAVGREKEGEPATTSAYLLYRNFGEKFPSNGTGIFWAPKTGTGLSCTIYKIQANFSLSLDLKPGTSNPNIWCRKFRSFRYKREKGNTFFAENFHRDEPFHLNSPWNFRVFHTNGKRSTSLEIEYLRRCEMLTGGDDISNDVITIGTCFSIFLYNFAVFSASHWLAEIWQLSRRGATGKLEVEFKFQALVPFPARRQSAPEGFLAG